MNRPLHEIDTTTGSAKRKRGNGRRRTSRTDENANVEERTYVESRECVKNEQNSAATGRSQEKPTFGSDLS